MGFLNWVFGGKTETKKSGILAQSKKPSGEEIQKILDKPWSEVTIEERKTLCTNDLGVHFSGGHGISKGEYLNKFPQKVDREVPEEMIEITKTWVIPPEGCPIPAHKLLDGQMILANEDFSIPNGEWAGYSAPSPSLFGIPELDENCTCFMVAGIFEKGTVAARTRNAQIQEPDVNISSSIYNPSFVGISSAEHPQPETLDNGSSTDSLDELLSSEEIPEVITIPEIHLSQESEEDNNQIIENFGKTKSQQEARKIAGERAEKNFDVLCDWIPEYIAAADKAGFHQRGKILGILKRETTFVFNQFKNLGRVDGYEISMMQTLENLMKYYDQVLFGEYPNHSKDTKRIIDSTSRKKKN